MAVFRPRPSNANVHGYVPRPGLGVCLAAQEQRLALMSRPFHLQFELIIGRPGTVFDNLYSSLPEKICNLVAVVLRGCRPQAEKSPAREVS